MTGADQTKKGIVEQPKPMLTNKKFVEKLLGIKGGLKAKHLEIKTKRPENKRDRRLYYGAWYIDPDNWHQRLSRQLGKLSKILHIVITKMYIEELKFILCCENAERCLRKGKVFKVFKSIASHSSSIFTLESPFHQVNSYEHLFSKSFLIETSGGAKVEDKTKARLKASLPGTVDMMGFQHPVSQLQVGCIWFV